MNSDQILRNVMSVRLNPSQSRCGEYCSLNYVPGSGETAQLVKELVMYA